MSASAQQNHSHIFLGADQARAEHATWMVVALCTATMIVEIVGGWMVGSLALIADGVHMSTHAGAMLLAALAYWCSRRYASDPRFSFGTGKLGDLSAFTSAIILGMIAIAVAVEAFGRLLHPGPIAFSAALPIAVLGLCVNVASVYLLHRGQGHSHGHAHDESHAHGHGHDETRRIEAGAGPLELSIFETGQPPRFRLRALSGVALSASAVTLATVRSGGARQTFTFRALGNGLETNEDIPEPHEFSVVLSVDGRDFPLSFAESPDHGGAGDDNNFRAAVVHVLADAAVSVFVIAGLMLAWAFGWVFLDPLAALVGAAVIASWSVTLIRDAGAVLLDIVPDRTVADALRAAIEGDGDQLGDFHLWRLGPGHLGSHCQHRHADRPERGLLPGQAHGRDGPFASDDRGSQSGLTLRACEPRRGVMSDIRMPSISGLYEAHLTVANLDVSIPFYRDVVGLELAKTFDGRKSAFFWIDGKKNGMLGLWETGSGPMRMRLHLAFRMSLEGVLASCAALRAKGVTPIGFHGTAVDEPDVLGWMPAVSQYFSDPDGHNLEFIAVLDDAPDEGFGVGPYSKWLGRSRK